MARAAARLLGSLDEAQRRAAHHDLASPERRRWTNAPVREQAGGVALGELDGVQLRAFSDLLATLLSAKGYEYCVRERALVSEDGFERLPAADRYRLLLGSLNIPVTMPSNATSLAAVSKEKDWTDAPQALTVIRNRLVHAGRKELKLTDEGYFEAWGLATWLLELAVLALCDFKGEHWNRVKGGKEPVPWAR